MMCSSAAVQVSLDAGTTGDGTQSATGRWQRAHALGPALVAAFACSPVLEGALTGWRSTRQRFWRDIDPSRTRVPDPQHDPVTALTDLALGAQLMTVRDAEGTCRPAPCGVSFEDWLTAPPAGVPAPTEADLAYHLTTLFPPVRLRGWFELRYLDALPDPLWQVAVAVAAALLDDDAAADAAREACAPVEGRWADAARLATADPALAGAATACLLAAADALPRLGAAHLAPAVLSYAERFPARGRCPADELVDAHRAGASAEDLLLGRVGVAA
jgi:glutamate--cysteine ligase